MADYCHRMLNEGIACFTAHNDDSEEIEPIPALIASLQALRDALQDIHQELEDLNAEAVQLAATIKKNLEELRI